MVMDSERTATLWLGVVEDIMGELHDEDKALVKALVHNILNRWSLKAADSSGGEVAVHARFFKTMYAHHKEAAQAVIVAIVELIQAVGNGEQLPESYKEISH